MPSLTAALGESVHRYGVHQQIGADSPGLGELPRHDQAPHFRRTLTPSTRAASVLVIWSAEIVMPIMVLQRT